MPRVCVSTGYTANMASYASFAEKTIRHYADVFDYDFVLCQEARPEKAPQWMKISVIMDLLPNYDYVFWIDADAIVRRFDVDVFKDIANDFEKDVYVHSHKFKGRDYVSPNTGVMLVRNTSWSRDFMQELWDDHDFKDHYWKDNRAFVQRMGLFSLLTLDRSQPDVPNPAVLSHIGELPERWNAVPWDRTEQDPVILHYCGCRQPHREKELPIQAANAFYEEIRRLRAARG